MVLGNKGQSFLVGIMVAIMGFIVAVIFIDPIKSMIETARSSGYLDCTATNLTTGVAATCLIVDLYLPYFIGFVMVAAGSWIMFKR